MNRKMRIMLGGCAGLILCALAMSMALAAQEKQNIAGKWEVSRYSESGVSYKLFRFDFQAAGENAFTGTVTLVAQKDEGDRTVAISNGVIHGDQVSFDNPGFTFEGRPGGPRFAGTYSGTLTGDELKFHIGTDEARKYTAKRKTAN